MNALITLFDLIGTLARKRHLHGDAEFAALGLNHTEARLLSLLHNKGGTASQDILSQMITVDRTNAGRALQRLEQQGYLERTTSCSDKRAKLVSLSYKGKEAVSEIRRLRHRIAQGFFGDLTEAEAQMIVDVLSGALGLEDGVPNA